MTERVRVMTVDQACRRRQDLLDSVGMTYEELSGNAAEYTLRGREVQVWEEIKIIDYLLKSEGE